VAVLATLIALLGPLSGAHFNPAVSLVEGLRGRLGWQETAAYVGVQVVGCCTGAILAHAMFELPLIQSSTHVRAGAPQLLAEFVATFGLLLVVLGHRRAEMHRGWWRRGLERLTGSPRRRRSPIQPSPLHDL
jgi:glycerol uptake facilitator-like aquaporin